MSEQQTKSPSLNRDNKPVRPALIVSGDTVSKYSVFLERLLVGFADESIPVLLVCPPGCDIEFAISGAAEFIRYPTVELPFIERLGKERLVEQLSKFAPTVLHCLCESKADLTRQLACELDLPYFLMVNAIRHGLRHSLRGLHRHLARSLEHCTGIIVPSRTIADDLVRTYPHLKQRIKQINIGTFIEKDCRCFSDQSRLASIIVWHTLDNISYFENLFSAARNLLLGGYEFMVVVMGTGKAQGQLRKLIAALGLLQTVTIVPALKPWRSALSAGDIFIRLQPNNAFDLLLLEAMSIGVAVAACKGGVDDLIIENRTAVVFEPNDETSILSTLQQLLGKRESAREIAGNAQQYLRKHHSVSRMITATIRAYQEAQK